MILKKRFGIGRGPIEGEFPAATGEFSPHFEVAFGPLLPGDSVMQNYSYAPSDRNQDDVVYQIQSDAGTIEVHFTGSGVGPVFASNVPVGTSLDFGAIHADETMELTLEISNASNDDDGGATQLTDLSLVLISIIGPDANLFSARPVELGMVIHKGGSVSIPIEFTPSDSSGDAQAALIVITDQGSLFGVSGETFSFQLHGTALPDNAIAAADASLTIPEPSTLTLAALGLIGCAVRWRRRRR